MKFALSAAPNGLRYPRVGGTRQRHFNGTNSKLHKLLENAQTPTTMAPAYFAGDRVHAVLGALAECQIRPLEQDTTTNLTKLLHTTPTLATDKKHDLAKRLSSKFSIK